MLPTTRSVRAACAETGPDQPENLSAWPVPDGPWQGIHIDFVGPFLDDMWLVVMDAYSKWPHRKYPTSETTTSALDDVFARWGRPRTRAGLRRSYLTMVHSSPQRRFLTGAMHTGVHI